jgi:hypothetical protein
LIDTGKHGLDDEDSSQAFMQSWLFWGLLSEFMLPAGVIDFQGQTVGFWIDSICVPVDDKPARAKAIEKMFDIYTGAFATIVLAAELTDFETGHTGYVEPAMRIAMSKWMRRLWCFQEGVMSRNLYFLFADVSQTSIGMLMLDLHSSYPAPFEIKYMEADLLTSAGIGKH